MFLPWYSVSITPAGAAEAQQQLATVAQQYGNPSLQNMASQVGGQFSSIAGRPLTTLSAHQALKNTSKTLLLLAGVALLASLLTLADVLEVSGGQIALVGFGAVLCVLFRVLSPPGADSAASSHSRSAGAAGSRSSLPVRSPAEGFGGLSPARASGRNTTRWAT